MVTSSSGVYHALVTADKGLSDLGAHLADQYGLARIGCFKYTTFRLGLQSNRPQGRVSRYQTPSAASGQALRVSRP